ncbi:MFS transporter [Jatrophihabitans telluris]|uniref:MFS transporter n=1 Tax=Jatrophihabitans telluris TaxID=2038343 RepID=A0ABY4QZC3_9ACTN|nr:MFS transporter [Jatrophihabitans telluris]UQX88954.1 MFS transporter [Jatrophihabitans telluris]
MSKSARSATATTSTTPSAMATTPRNLRFLTAVLAAATGLTVANIYYSQPLLDLIAKAFHTSESRASMVVTATQLGYAAGLILLLPLGDLFENRKLTSRVLLVAAVMLAAAAASPNLAAFLILSVLIGFTSVVAQILIPFAAHLAPEAERGQFVGRVMSGLLLGILLARTVSSLLAAAFGWRSVYVISAVFMLTIAVLLARTLPSRRPDHTTGYRSLMASVLDLARTVPAVRRRAVCQALIFGAFSAFWTSIAYELIAEHHLSQTGIAIFALVGAAGAVAAPIAGRVADAGYGQPASGVTFLLAAGSMVLAIVGHHQLVLLAVAAVLLDLAVQGHQVLSQQEIYALRPDARARINTVFMGTVFTGGAVSSALSGLFYQTYGWSGAGGVCLVLATLGFGVWGVAAILRGRTAS